MAAFSTETSSSKLLLGSLDVFCGDISLLDELLRLFTSQEH